MLAALAAASPAARAETLADAIALAYQSNPTLQSQRAQLRALDETYVQARAGWRPTATVQLSSSYSNADSPNFLGTVSNTQSNSGGGGLSISQPVLTGGRVSSAVSAAEADVLGGREALRAGEGQILQTVIQAYADVRRDQAVLVIRQNEVELLQAQLDDARARFSAGEVTRTDVSQSAAQLASARAQLSLAAGQVQVSRATYAAVVGQEPGDLAPAPPLPGLPLTADEAFDAAEVDNPTLRRAQFTEHASRARIASAKATGRPSVDIRSTLGYTGTVAPFSTTDYNRAFSATAVLTQPLFTGGVVSSNVRRAKELNMSDRIGVEGARRSAVQAASQTWNQMLAVRASAFSLQEQAREARLAFQNTQEEYRVGQRSTLDVLIAEQTLRDAELNLVQTRRDEYVTEAALLNAMGRLEAGNLVPGIPLYDPAKSFKHVKSLGSVPWESVVAAIDQLSAPRDAQPVAVRAPAPPSQTLQLAPSLPLPALTTPPATVLPTSPFPNTVSPRTPARVDSVDPSGPKQTAGGRQ